MTERRGNDKEKVKNKKMSKIKYNKENKIISIKISNNKSIDSDVQNNVVIDYDKNNNITNIDIMNISIDEFEENKMHFNEIIELKQKAHLKK